MELAELRARPWRSASSAANAASSNTALTELWQSSKSPPSRNTVRLSPGCVTICSSCSADTPASG